MLLNRQLHEHLRQRNRAKLSWAQLRHLLPWLRFLGPQSSGAVVAAVHSFVGQCGTNVLVQMPIHSRNTAGTPSALPIAAMPALRQPLGPGSATSTTPLAIRFTNFAGLTAAHCSFIRACTSAAVCVFCGARTGLQDL